MSRETLLAALVRDYASHQAWRCQYPGRYPHDPDCPCGLLSALEEAGLRDLAAEFRDLAIANDPEANDPKATA